MVSPEGNKESETKRWYRRQQLQQINVSLANALKDCDDEELELKAVLTAAMEGIKLAMEILSPTPVPPRVRIRKLV